jgi:deoxyribodipyrimidine photolyase
VLAEAGVELGRTYPRPMVDHRLASEWARTAYGEQQGATC